MKLFKNNKNIFFLIFFLNFLLSLCFKNLNRNNNLNNNFSHENSKLNEKLIGKLNGEIYLNEQAEKHKKSKSNSQNMTKKIKNNLKTIEKLLKSNNGFSSKKENAFQTNSKHTALLEKNSKNESENSGSILYAVWIKYFKYTNKSLSVKSPKEFEINTSFNEQKRIFSEVNLSKTNISEKNDYIKNQNYFYLSIFKNSLLFNSSKKVRLKLFLDNFIIF